MKYRLVYVWRFDREAGEIKDKYVLEELKPWFFSILGHDTWKTVTESHNIGFGFDENFEISGDRAWAERVGEFFNLELPRPDDTLYQGHEYGKLLPYRINKE